MIYVIENETGRIVQRIAALDEHAEHYERAGCSVVVTDQIVDVGSHYIAAGKFVVIPEKPSNYHDWDWTTHVWVENPALVATAYIAQRRAAYPSIGDQLDALWKGGTAYAEMHQKVLAVKAAIPKLQEGTEQ